MFRRSDGGREPLTVQGVAACRKRKDSGRLGTVNRRRAQTPPGRRSLPAGEDSFLSTLPVHTYIGDGAGGSIVTVRNAMQCDPSMNFGRVGRMHISPVVGAGLGQLLATLPCTLGLHDDAHGSATSKTPLPLSSVSVYPVGRYTGTTRSQPLLPRRIVRLTLMCEGARGFAGLVPRISVEIGCEGKARNGAGRGLGACGGGNGMGETRYPARCYPQVNAGYAVENYLSGSRGRL